MEKIIITQSGKEPELYLDGFKAKNKKQEFHHICEFCNKRIKLGEYHEHLKKVHEVVLKI